MPLARADVVAIDMHVHPQTEEFIASMGPRAAQMAAHSAARPTSRVHSRPSPTSTASGAMMAVLLNTTDVSSSGWPGVPNDVIARAVNEHPDVFIGFGVIEPQLGELARDEIKRCAEELGLVGIGELIPVVRRFIRTTRSITRCGKRLRATRWSSSFTAG